MSCNSKICGYSIKFGDYYDESAMKDIAKKLGHTWNEEDEEDWKEFLYCNDKNLNKWKPHIDYNGNYGVIYVTEEEYEAFDIEFYVSITDMGKALKEYIDITCHMPDEHIKAFAIIYYNGSDNPFKF